MIRGKRFVYWVELEACVRRQMARGLVDDANCLVCLLRWINFSLDLLKTSGPNLSKVMPQLDSNSVRPMTKTYLRQSE